MPCTLRIGLTGAVGAGKSSVRCALVGLGAAGLDADRLVHRLLEHDRSTIRAVADAFGDEFVGQGGIDRTALSEVVFRDARSLARLEAILHPEVTRAAEAWMAASRAPAAVVEAVKLVESGMHRSVDSVWLVTCAADVRRGRLAERGWSDDEVARRMGSGGRAAAHLAAADIVIDNSGARGATAVQVERAWRSLQRWPPNLHSDESNELDPKTP